MEVNIRNFDNIMNFQRVHKFIDKYHSDGVGGIVRQFISKIEGKDTTPEEVIKAMLRYNAKHEEIITNNYEDALHVAKYYIAYNKLSLSDKKFITKNRHRHFEGEKGIQNGIESYLRTQQDSGKIEYIKNSVATRFVGEDTYVSIQSKSGSPDLFVFMKDTNKDCLRTIGLEVKTEIGKQLPGQIGWQERFEKLGGEYYIVRNIDDVIKIIEKEVEI